MFSTLALVTRLLVLDQYGIISVRGDFVSINNSRITENNSHMINQGLVYALIILVTFIVTICFFKLIEFGTIDSQFTSKFEFGATISSIILSVVAIVYTLIQSKQSEITNTKVIDASDKIQTTTKLLNTSVEKMQDEVNSFKKMDIENILTTNMKNFENQLNRLEEIFSGRFKGIEETLYNFKLTNDTHIRSASSEQIEKLKEYLEYMVDQLLQLLEAENVNPPFPAYIYTYLLINFFIEFYDKSYDDNIYKYSEYVLAEINSLNIYKYFLRIDSLRNIYIILTYLGFVQADFGKKGTKTLIIDIDYMKERLNESKNHIISLDETVIKHLDNRIKSFKS